MMFSYAAGAIHGMPVDQESDLTRLILVPYASVKRLRAIMVTTAT
jgi:hypothetical protein